MKTIVYGFVGLMVVVLSGQAQVANEGLAMKIIQARQTNAAQLKQFSWNTRVELLDNGTVKDIRIDSVAFGPDGKPQYTLMNDQPSPLPHGFLRKRIAEKEREKVEKYLKGLRATLDEYTLPTAGKILDFVSQSTISAPDANGLLQLTGNSVVRPGDVFTLWVDAAKHQTRKIQLTTTVDQDFVEATATFVTMPNGLNHLQFATVSVPAKNLELQVHNYDYNANN